MTEKRQDHHHLRRATPEDGPGAVTAIGLEIPAFVLDVDHHARRDQRAMLGRQSYAFTAAAPDYGQWPLARQVARDLLAGFERSADTPQPRIPHKVTYLF